MVSKLKTIAVLLGISLWWGWTWFSGSHHDRTWYLADVRELDARGGKYKFIHMMGFDQPWCLFESCVEIVVFVLPIEPLVDLVSPGDISAVAGQIHRDKYGQRQVVTSAGLRLDCERKYGGIIELAPAENSAPVLIAAIEPAALDRASRSPQNRDLLYYFKIFCASKS